MRQAAIPLRTAEALNQECRCSAVDLPLLRARLEQEIGRPGLGARLLAERPHLFSELPVFVSREQVARMAEIVRAVESVVALPAWRDHVLVWAPETALADPGPLGVFLGYDFHIGPGGPSLIEINTNAGGACVNLFLAAAQRACCVEAQSLAGGPSDVAALEASFAAMFRAEWRFQRGDAPLATIAIVDDDPSGQYLYPEFLLFERLFERHGLAAVTADPRELELRDGALWAGGRRIDLVYNRLTDFALDQSAHAVLRRAWLEGAAVVTPHPRAHALYADKRNFAALTDPELLRRWGVAAHTIELLSASIPRTVVVDAAQAHALWAARRGLFFKPAAGYGSKGSYRGDKLTRRVFGEILAGSYIAQDLVPPTERVTPGGDLPPALKLDLRNYVYDGQVQLIAARLYHDQVTNFRTPGGGFAPVFHPA